MKFFEKMLQCFNKLCYDLFRTEKNEISYFGVNDMSKYNKGLENIARDILVQNDMLKIPVNLIDIANKNDIEVYYTSLPKGISGAIKYNKEKEKFQILIENSEPNYRKRFTLAHELAHFFLQRENLLNSSDIHFDVLYRNTISNHEREVDYLAGAILMEESILERLYRINPSIKELSKVFNVSESAMTVRLMQVGLL